MGRLNKLTDRYVKTAKPGIYGDGGGLWLRVNPGADGSPNRGWVFRFAMGGTAHAMGLGPLHTIGLAEAREEALECRKLIRQGINPIEYRRRQRAAAQVEEKPTKTFRQAAEEYIAVNEAGWGRRHWKDYVELLQRHAYPTIGDERVDAIDTEVVLRALQPIWNDKTETASRLRARLEQILDFARVRGWRSGENPARWRGHLKQVLPKPSKVHRTKHHPALPYREVPELMAKLAAIDSPPSAALKFLILTAARTSEVRFATWDEINGDSWCIPRERMQKGDRPHRVPLGPAAQAILAKMREVRTGDLIFQIGRTGMIDVIQKQLGIRNATPHGMRSAFRDWASECTNAPREVCEMALAHAVGDGTEQAYARSDLYEKRRKLMLQWDRYCTKPAGEVVQLRTAK
jgi:integrase